MLNTRSQNMIYVVLVLWFFGAEYTLGITVSPDLGKRNQTALLHRDQIASSSSIAKNNNVNISLADRNRRLVPYMTFYVPEEIPVSQYYAIDMPQQHQQRPQQQQQFHAVLYGTRHQIPHKSYLNNNYYQHNSNHQDHMPVPISYKQSNIYKVSNQKQNPVRLYPSPFRAENKVPGPFIPIVYPESEQLKVNLQQSSQNDEIPTGYFIQEHALENNHRPQQIVDESTARPLYPLTNELNVKNVYQSQRVQQIPESQLINRLPRPSHEEQHRIMTPEEKYVLYLEEQLVHKQRQHQQKHQKIQKLHPIQSAQPQPEVYHQQESPTGPAHIILVSSTPAPLPENQILYQEKPEKNDYKQILSVYHSPIQQHNIHSQRQHQLSENQQNYIEYVQPDILKIPARVTTPAPHPQTIIVSTGRPIYSNHQVVQRLKPISSTSQQASLNQQIHKQEKRPVYIQKLSPTIAPQTVRQHLTETTQTVQPQMLTTYHPTFATTSKPKYEASYYVSTEKPLKLKPSLRYKPIVVTKPVPSPIQTRHPTPPTIIDTPASPTNHKDKPLPDFKSSSLADILRKLQESNHLPQTLTPDNIDNSIRTLIKILNNLKQSQTIVENPPQHHDEDYEYDDSPPNSHSEPGPNSGRPGIDYPALAEIPQTKFNCKEQRYKGFFGDPETNCQVWHYCDLNGGQASFLCPNGTIFSQVALTCDWWFNVKCSSTAQLYVLNERLYKYILPFTPKFPEDYSGPLVDKYLALKFKEMEEKMKREKTKGKANSEETESSNENDDDDDEKEKNQTNNNESQKSIENTVGKLSSEENDEIENQGSIDTGILISSTTTPSTLSSTKSVTDLPMKYTPILIATTGSPFIKQSSMSPPLPITSSASIAQQYSPISSSPSTSSKLKTRTSVESEKVEVIEIKTDGTSGHLYPEQ